MSDERFASDSVAIANLADFLQVAAQQSWPIHEEQSESSSSYRLALGQVPIQLGIVEFRLLLFLASKPYHAFTRRAISEAITSVHHHVSAEEVDLHFASLVHE